MLFRLTALLAVFLAAPVLAASPTTPYQPSPDGTQVCGIGGGLIVDNNGNIWGIVPGTGNGQVAYNGKIIAPTAQVDELEKALGGAIWQHGANNWYKFGPVDSKGVPTTVAGPLQTPPISVNSATVLLQLQQAETTLNAAMAAAKALK